MDPVSGSRRSGRCRSLFLRPPASRRTVAELHDLDREPDRLQVLLEDLRLSPVLGAAIV